MRSLVSGASGFIGQALVAQLESQGMTVHRVVRSNPGPGDAHLDLAQRRLDLSRLPGSDLSQIDLVFHLAGEPITPIRWTPAKRERIRASRVVSTDILARALARADRPDQVLVCASAIGVYGNRGDVVLDESSPAGTGFLAEVCRAWEAATGPAREAGLRVVNARSGIVLGTSGGALPLQRSIFRLGLGGRLGDGHQWTSWIALSDEIEALLFVANNGAIAGPVNLTAPHPVTNNEFTQSLARSVGRSARLFQPKPLLRLAVGKQVSDEMLLASQRVLPKRLEDKGFSFRFPALDGALESLDDHASTWGSLQSILHSIRP